ncbi:NADH-quinone oxidoreductase subunit N [bacterium]|nr:NADH-quinone oxidoreductase subunit N [bacterium]MCI0602400.1 NADH-quinone oxidoreductase subunit N [bacterium]
MDPDIIQQIQSSIPYFVPELMLTATFLLVLIGEIISKRSSYVGFGIITAAGLIATIFLSLQLYKVPDISLFFRMIVVDRFAIFFKVIFSFSAILIVLFSMNSNELKKYSAGEYYCLLLSVVLGMNLLASSTNLLMIWLALELVSIPSYLLSGFLKDDRLSAEAALKFVIYGSVSTAIMLFGLSYLYGMTGAYEINDIRNALRSSQVNSAVLLITVSLILVGVGYKIAAVPFHFWLPDVFQGSPTAITAFFSYGPKAAGFAFLIRLFYGVFAEGGPDYKVVGQLHWPTLMALIAAITMTVGNVVAIWQTSMKRMLAYSSIAHVGYMLMGFVLLRQDGIEAILFYLLVYMVMNLGAFLVVIALSSHMDSDNLAQYRGLRARSPFAASMLAMFMLSLTGIPPFAGFIGKFYLFAAAVHAQFYWLVIVAVLNSVVSFVYYGGVVKRMFLEEGSTDPIQIPQLSRVLLVLFGVALLVMGIYWSPFADYSHLSANILFEKARLALR